jgi:hypothetical protein
VIAVHWENPRLNPQSLMTVTSLLILSQYLASLHPGVRL